MKSKTELQYPNFLIIGAGKSGTTSVYNYLKQHPQVYMSPVKEPDFFALEGQEAVKPEDDIEETHNYPWAVFKLDDYKKLFANVKNEKAVGESSTMYLYKPDTHLRIKKYVPNVKMIAIFRDPVSRLYSRYLHLARENRLPSESFEDAFDKDSVWWRRDDLIPEGFFYKHLSKYFQTFKPEQFKILLFEDLRENTNKVIKELYQFLDIDDSFIPQTDIRYNESGFVKNKFKDKFIGQQSFIRKGVEKIFPNFINKLRNSTSMQKIVTKMRSKNLEKPKLSPEIRKRLINEIYKEDILKFQKLINRDLSKWLE
ncbi:MAG: sulfotransferase [Bacteroidota bacterium]|nr:sulfotransferase [Bacteroidota bacterium]